jgi:hypothetical protein
VGESNLPLIVYGSRISFLSLTIPGRYPVAP